MSIYLLEFTTLALAHFVALLSPGPDFFLIVGHSLRYGYRPTFWACSGIALANGVYILLALLGFSLLHDNPFIYQGMKLFAACYLLYLGILLMKTARQDMIPEADSLQRHSVHRRDLFLRGFLSAILNPKNIVFYLSLMTLLVSPRTPLGIQLAYGVWMISIVFFWDCLIAWGIGNHRMQQILNQHTYKLEKASGALLMLMGIVVIL